MVVGLVVFILNWPSSSVEWAAWAQAFGSIGAVGAAVFVMNTQRKDLVDLKNNDKKKALLYILRMVDAVDDLTDKIIENTQDDKTNYKEQFKNILKWMEKVDPLEKDLDGVAMSYLEVQLQVLWLVEEFDFEKDKRNNYRNINEKFLPLKIRFEIFREKAQKTSSQEMLGIQVKMRGCPQSLIGTAVAVKS